MVTTHLHAGVRQLLNNPCCWQDGAVKPPCSATLPAHADVESPAQADIEFPTGALNMVFLRHMITNAYKNVSNVVFAIQPAGVADRPALLLNAHFDSTLGSAGAPWLQKLA